MLPPERDLANGGKLFPTWHSQISYSHGLLLQSQSIEKVKLNPSEIHLLGLHHDFVITLGRRAQAEIEVSWPQSKLLQERAEVVKTDRGGLATLHSPGQLVIYPVFNLEHYRLSIKEYVDLLLRTTQLFLGSLGVESFIQEGQPGLFTKNGKIVFIGIRVREGICSHGIAINIFNDLSLFDSIQSCGVHRPQLDRLANDLNLAILSIERLPNEAEALNELLKEFYFQWVRHFNESLNLFF